MSAPDIPDLMVVYDLRDEGAWQAAKLPGRTTSKKGAYLDEQMRRYKKGRLAVHGDRRAADTLLLVA
jgi:hypothetical protein